MTSEKMSPDEKTLRWWDEQRRGWQKIFSGQEYKNKDLLKSLIKDWGNFRPITLQLGQNISKIRGADKHLISAQEFLQKAQNFFHVESADKLPTTGNLIAKLKEAAEYLTLPDTKSFLTEEIVRDTFKKTVDETEQELINEEKAETEKRKAEADERKAKSLQGSAENHTAHVFETDSFYVAIQRDIISALIAEAERIKNEKHDDERIFLINNVQKDLTKVLEKTQKIYTENFVQHKGANFDDAPIKEKCKKEMHDVIETKLVNNDDLGNHRIWGTKFGRALLNILLALPLFLPAAIKKLATGETFFSFETESQKKTKDILETLEKIDDEKPKDRH